MMKNTTILHFAKQSKKFNSGTQMSLTNLKLSQLSVSKFFDRFGEMTPDELVEFVDSGKNSFELGRFGSEDYFKTWPAYNGKNFDLTGNGERHTMFAKNHREDG